VCVALAREVAVREAAQLGVDDGGEAFERPAVALAPGREQFGDFVGRGVSHIGRYVSQCRGGG
jgi:hypothetical protein